ncbi:MAG: F0F1 ATP synthase subunit A [Verrucomicrobiota bacterium]
MRPAFIAIILFLLPAWARAAEAVTPAAGAAAEQGIAEGLPPNAPDIFPIGPFQVTSSMLVTWIVAAGIIIFARVATRKVKEVPDGAQNFWEWMVESLYEFLEGVVGPDLVKKTFWFFATIFIFILFTNWFGLLPGVGTIGWGSQGPGGFEVTHPLLRGGNADLNMTSAMAVMFMVCWLVWALQSDGIWGFTLHIFGPKGDNTGFLKYMMIVVFFLVGFLELLSIAFRPISLSFRLYGNIFAGENLLDALSSTVRHPAWARAVFSALLPAPFYFLELLVGMVQAMVFMLLTAVFTVLICEHDEGDARAHH